MVKNILSLFYTFCAFTAFSLFYSQNGYSQTQGLSLHTDFLSLMLPQGFDNNYYHPGSFLGGFQYIFPVSTGFGLSLGVDLMYGEATGTINSNSRQIEFFVPSLFAGIDFDFDGWGLFGKAGYAPAGSVNLHDRQNWVTTIQGFDMYPLQFGLKYNIIRNLDFTLSVENLIGNSLKIDNKTISVSTIGFGLSYNLFNSDTESADENSNDNYKKMYNDLLAENEKLEKQNLHLIKQSDEIIGRLKSVEINSESTVDSAQTLKMIKSISIDSINTVYNLHIGKPLKIKDFVNKKRMTDAGKLILAEYNQIASSLNGFPSGIWFVCLVPDLSFFAEDKNDFPRIEFIQNSDKQKNLVLKVDVKKTENKNGIKLDVRK